MKHLSLKFPARTTERIVGLGFRCSLACLRSSDAAEARRACTYLTTALCADNLPAELVPQFAAWALAIESSAERPIAVLPIKSASFGRDECLAISLVAACQHQTCPALRACAFALLGSADLGRALAATATIAATLRGSDALLASSKSEAAAALIPLAPRLH